MSEINADNQEVAKFSELAHRWWDPESEFRPLHDINPLRLGWIEQAVSLQGKKVLDIGCGGGILSEGMARQGANVTGIDLSSKALSVARLHLYESHLEVDYQESAAETFAQEHPASFDVVTCMEMLEHVPDPSSVIKACATLVKPGGHVFLSTLNRNPKSYVMAIIGAEYILNLLPRGTHDYAKFIRPSEMAQYLREADLTLHSLTGMHYNPFNRRYGLGKNPDVNYMAHAVRNN